MLYKGEGWHKQMSEEIRGSVGPLCKAMLQICELWWFVFPFLWCLTVNEDSPLQFCVHGRGLILAVARQKLLVSCSIFFQDRDDMLKGGLDMLKDRLGTFKRGLDTLKDGLDMLKDGLDTFKDGLDMLSPDVSVQLYLT